MKNLDIPNIDLGLDLSTETIGKLEAWFCKINGLTITLACAYVKASPQEKLDIVEQWNFAVDAARILKEKLAHHNQFIL